VEPVDCSSIICQRAEYLIFEVFHMNRSSTDSYEGECYEQTPVSNKIQTRRRRYQPLGHHNHYNNPFFSFLPSRIWSWPNEDRVRMPSMDFKDRGNKFVLTAEIPGVEKDEIDISITNNRIHLKADHSQQKMDEGECYVCQERTSTNYHRVFEFPEEVNSEKVEATLENGVLTVELPKKEKEAREGVKKLKVK